MRFFTLVLVHLFTCACPNILTKWQFGTRRIIPCTEENKIPAARIMGGEPTHIKEYPFIVSIQRKRSLTKHLCGGSILNTKWILTAAHCVCYSKTKNIKPASDSVVLSGLTNCRNIRYWNQVSEVTAAYKHPQYDSKKVYNDIALMKLKKTLVFSTSIQPVKLATPEMLGKRDVADLWPRDCVAIGWGKTNVTGPTSDVLRVVGLPLLGSDQCNRMYFRGMYLRSTQICTLYAMGGKDACFGDSGGPLVCGGYQVGVTSWGRGCGSPDHPGIWTRVDKYQDWINAVINSHIYTPPRHISYTIVYFLLAMSCLLIIIGVWEIRNRVMSSRDTED